MTNNYSYWKSTYSNTIYKMPADWTPKFGGWEPVHKETYINYCKENDLTA